MSFEAESSDRDNMSRKVHSRADLVRADYRRLMAANRFEMRRTLTAARIGLWLILVIFPSVIMGIFRYNNADLEQEVWGVALYVLATQATPLLGLLQWVAPAIQVEMEGGTWPYVAVRPGAKIAVLLGKYLNGIIWTMAAGTTGLTAALLVGWPPADSRWKLLAVLFAVQVLGSFSYGALYLLIGVLFPKRSMVVAVAYTIVFEVIVSALPANINQLTVQHRLWCLLWTWMNEWQRPEPIQLTLDDMSAGIHLLVLAGYTLSLLAVACIVVCKSEYQLTTNEV